MIEHALPHSAGASVTERSNGALRSVQRGEAVRERAGDESHDAALLAAVALGDAAAFEEVYLRHVRAVTAAAQRICVSASVAEEIAQRTFTKLWERAGRLASKSVRLRPWLCTVARNAAIDHLRSENAFVPLTAENADVFVSACPQDEAVMNALVADLGPALAALPVRQRGVIELHYFGGLSFPAIARQTGEPLETIKSRARLGLERLRRVLAPHPQVKLGAIPKL